MGTIGTNRVARENGDNWDKQKVVPRVAAGYAQRLKMRNFLSSISNTVKILKFINGSL